MSKKQKGSWVVRVQETVVREMVCDNCTEEEAREHPFDHAVGDVTEVDSSDWDVISVEPNE